jgi:alanine racemase
MPAARARLTIDLDALVANHAVLKRLSGGAEVAPVVKADGYGLGAAEIARRLWSEGARSYFVARLEEGEALRGALGPHDAQIYVFDGCTAGSAPRLGRARLIPVLNSPGQVEGFAAYARTSTSPPPCALHIDTGMNRLGLRIEELKALTAATDRLTGLDIRLLVSHLACGDQEIHPLNAEQAVRFEEARAMMPGVPGSLANTAGVWLGPRYRQDMVRPGIGLYGGGPFGAVHPELKPVATFEAPILQVRPVAEGETVGYGADFRAERPYRVAIVAAGYADGVLRSAAGQGAVWLDGGRRALLGRVSMDLIAVDVTGCESAQPGAMVEILGPHIALDEAAAAAGTISYEVLTRLGSRVERVYLGAARDEAPALQ